MKPQSRLVFFTFITLLVLVANLVMPTSALADDGVPPESPPAEAPPVETPPVDEAPPPEAPVSLPEVLEQAPPDTQVVVVNDEGQVEPLATVEAAEILVTGDPVWCPAAVGSPTPDLNGCTSSHTTMTSLVTQLSGGGFTGPGIIWVEPTYTGLISPGVYDNASLNHSVLSNLSDLTVQGNGGTPTFVVPLNILDWVGNVTLNNLAFNGAGAYLDTCNYDSVTGLCAGTGNITVTNSTFTGAPFNGLVTDSGGSTTLNNVTANGNNLNGAFITAYDDSGVPHDVTVTDGSFSGNGNGSGLDILSDGDIELHNVTADGNNTGAIVDNTPGTGIHPVDGGQYNDNDWDGLDVWSAGNITVDSAVVSDNSSPGLDTYGAYLDATAGTGEILVSNSTFNSNDGYGFLASQTTMSRSTTVNVDGGGITDDGAWIKSINGTATVNGGTFTNNTKSGLIAIGGA